MHLRNRFLPFLFWAFSSFCGVRCFHPWISLSSCIQDLTARGRFILKICLAHQILRGAESQHFHLQLIFLPKSSSSSFAFCQVDQLIVTCSLLPNQFIDLLHHFRIPLHLHALLPTLLPSSQSLPLQAPSSFSPYFLCVEEFCHSIKQPYTNGSQYQ